MVLPEQITPGAVLPGRPGLRREILEGLEVVEQWNSADAADQDGRKPSCLVPTASHRRSPC